MKFDKLKTYLNIKNLNDIKEVKKAYKNFAKKFHPDVSNNDPELFAQVSALYNEYIQIYKNLNLQSGKKHEWNTKDNSGSNSNKNYDFNQEKNIEKDCEEFINIDIIIPIEELLFKNKFELFVNNQIIEVENKEIKNINGVITKNNLKINYTIRMKKNIYLDGFGRIIKEIYIPFPLFIFGGKITTDISNYSFDIILEKNHKINEILEIKSDKFKRLFFIKLLPLFPNLSELSSKEKECLKNMIQKKYKI